MLSATRRLENRILQGYSAGKAMKHVEILSRLGEKAPGNAAEEKACAYIVNVLENYNVDLLVQEFDCFTGYRGEGFVELVSSEKKIPCVVQGFSGSTQPGGVEGELVYVSDESKVSNQNLYGKIVLLDGAGMGQAERAVLMDSKGVLGQIYSMANDQDVVLCMQNKCTWGNPTIETLMGIPRSPIVNITKSAADQLKAHCKTGITTVKLHAEALVGWKKSKQPIATLFGKDRKKHIMINTHYCSWWDGAVDDCAPVAVNLELARVFSENRKQLRRSIKFAFWMGHTHATFAGSTYYVDNSWQDIKENLIAEFYIDSLGIKGSSCPPYITEQQPEFRELHLRTIHDVTGFSPSSGKLLVEKPRKLGDASFWGIGVPRVARDYIESTTNPWFWHTSEDTIDKVDMSVAKWIYQTYALSALRIVNSSIIPANFTMVADEYEDAVRRLPKARDVLDLDYLLKNIKTFRTETVKLHRASRKARGKKIDTINECLIGLSRITIPTFYQRTGKYQHDQAGSASAKKPLPGLHAIMNLAEMDRESAEFKLAITTLKREKNRACDTMDEAIDLIRRTLS